MLIKLHFPIVALIFTLWNVEKLICEIIPLTLGALIINLSVLAFWKVLDIKGLTHWWIRETLLTISFVIQSEQVGSIDQDCQSFMALGISYQSITYESSKILDESQRKWLFFTSQLIRLTYVGIRLGFLFESHATLYVLLFMSIFQVAVYKKKKYDNHPFRSYEPSEKQRTKTTVSRRDDTPHDTDHYKRWASSSDKKSKGMNIFLNIVEEFPEGVTLYQIQQTGEMRYILSNNCMMEMLKTSDGNNVLDELQSLDNLKRQRQKLKLNNLSDDLEMDQRLLRKLYRGSVPGKVPSSLQDINESTTNVLDLEIKSTIKQIFRQEIYEYLQRSKQVFHLFSVVNGKKKNMLYEIKIYGGINKSIPHILIITSDISFRDTIQDLQAQNESKSNQLNYVSHEFRTPLNCIITMLEVYLDESQVSKYIKIALENSKYLLSLSNDLLDLASIKVGKFKLNKSTFNLKELLQECINMFELMTLKQRVNLVLTLGEDVPLIMYQDRNRIKQVILNLIGNSFKYTLEGIIQIKGTYNPYEQAVNIEVSDTGTGIRKEDQHKLIKAFGKGDNIEDKKYNKQGVGLGLLISNMISKQLSNSGRGLQISSQYGRGTQILFTVSYEFEVDSQNTSFQKNIRSKLEPSYSVNKLEGIPFMTITDSISVMPSKSDFQYYNVPSEDHPNEVKVSIKSCKCPKILIVDDNQFNIDAMMLRLQKQGHNRNDFAISGTQAIEKVLARRRSKCCPYYKIIFMDIDMPNLNGFDTFRKLKTMIPNEYLVTVACSGYSDESEKVEAETIGIIDYLEKPINAVKLREILIRLL